MMYSFLKKVILSLLIIVIIFPYCLVEAMEYKKDILLIYDSYKKYGGSVNYLDKITKSILVTNSNLKILRNVDFDNNSDEEDIKSCDGIVVLINDNNSNLNSYKEKIYSYNKPIIWVDNIEEDEGLNKIISLNDEIHDKFNIKRYKDNNYFMISKVYPYDDLNLLIEKVDFLHKEGVPFLIEAMPVFDNLYFDSMKDYTEALRYCASKGGTIILGSPYIYGDSINEEELIKKMNIAQEAFVNYWVYPIALTIEDSWIYKNDMKGYLSQSSTILLRQNEEVGILGEKSYVIEGFENVLIEKDLSKEESYSNERNIVYSLSNNYPLEQLHKEVKEYKRKNISFKNPITLESTIKFGTNNIRNDSNGIYLGNQNVSSTRFISKNEFEKTFSKDKVIKEKVIDLTNINKFIFVIAAIGGVIFLIFFLNSLKIDKRKYFK